MSILSNIKRGVQQRPQRVIIYGPEGVGKSTLAAGFPSPLLLDTEQGSSLIDVPRVDCQSFEDVLNAIEALRVESHDFKTVIIDSIDWAERFMQKSFVAEYNRREGKNCENIEDMGYGKGYKMIEPLAMNLLMRLNGLMNLGMDIVLVGHSRRVKFEPPEASGSYDKYELNLSKYVSPVVKEWADAMLFCNFVVTVQGGKGQGGSQRVVCTSPSAPWEAKNRHGMPAIMPMDAGEIGALLFAPAPAAAPPASQEQEEGMAEKLKAIIDALPGAMDFLVYKEQIQPGQGVESIPGEFARFILSATDRFRSAVTTFNAQPKA